MNKSYMPCAQNIERKWYVIDAENVVLGRLATEVASILRGKNKPTFTPNVDCGDYVIVINAKDAVLTGKKLEQKLFRRYSRYPGGLRSTTYKDLMAQKPVLAMETAIKGMLPHNRLGRQMYKKLFVYAGADHKHQAQKPEVLEIIG
jgi:large subunit ribosomal protein L13